MGVFFPTKRDPEREGGKEEGNRGGEGRGRGQRRGEPSLFQGEKENESKWSTASSARAGADEPGSGLPACGGGCGPGEACFKFNPNLTVWIEPEGIEIPEREVQSKGRG